MKYIFMKLICVYFVFSTLIAVLPMTPPGFVEGKIINEIMQDRYERVFGIRDLLETALSKPLKTVLRDKHDLTGNEPPGSGQIDCCGEDDFLISQGIGESFTIGNPGRGFFLVGKSFDADRSYRNWPVNFEWNPQLIGYVKLDFDTTFFMPYIVLWITGSIVFLFIYFLFTFNSLFPQKPFESWRSAFDIFKPSCLFPLYVIAFVAWLIFLFIYFPANRNYETSYHDTLERLNSNHQSMRILLDSTSETSLAKLDCLQDMSFNTPTSELVDAYFFPLGRQEKNIHNGSVFVSKKPFFPYNYIRINVDLFNYLFYAPGLTVDDLKKLNDQMQYRYLGNDIWLGQYRKYIDAVTELHWAYIISILLWCIMILISVCKYRAILKRSGVHRNDNETYKE